MYGLVVGDIHLKRSGGIREHCSDILQLCGESFLEQIESCCGFVVGGLYESGVCQGIEEDPDLLQLRGDDPELNNLPESVHCDF